MDCWGKVKNIYTNPDTPCQNYTLMGLTVICLIFTIVIIGVLCSKK